MFVVGTFHFNALNENILHVHQSICELHTKIT
jgi:hypothetical protein